MELSKPFRGPQSPSVDVEIIFNDFISGIRWVLLFLNATMDRIILYFIIQHSYSSDMTGLYHYEGSLTTPGCAEIVQWVILDKPLYVRKNGHVHLGLVSINKQYASCMF